MLQFPELPVGVAVAVTVMVEVGVPPQGAATGAGAGVATAKTTKRRMTERIDCDVRANILGKMLR